MLLIEHTINIYKKFKKLTIRYDKYANNYKTYLYLASIFILLKKSGI